MFVIYEFKEAVDTATEIFKDVKLFGRPIRMFSKNDIENIHTRQEEELTCQNSKRQREIDNDYNRPIKQLRYEEFPRQSHHQRFHAKERSSFRNDYSGGSNYENSVQLRSEESSRHSEHYRKELNSPSSFSETDRVYPELNSSNNSGYQSDLAPNNRRYFSDDTRRTHDSHRHEDYRGMDYNKQYDRRNRHRSRSPSSFSHYSRDQYQNQRHQNHSYKSRRY